MRWDEVPLQPSRLPLAPSHSDQYLFPFGLIGRLNWYAFAVTTGTLPSTRYMKFPFKVAYWDPLATWWKCAGQGASRTNHYMFGVGLPYSDSLNQVWRTFPIPNRMELVPDNCRGGDIGPDGDTWIVYDGAAAPGDQGVVAWSFKERPV